MEDQSKLEADCEWAAGVKQTLSGLSEADRETAYLMMLRGLDRRLQSLEATLEARIS